MANLAKRMGQIITERPDQKALLNSLNMALSVAWPQQLTMRDSEVTSSLWGVDVRKMATRLGLVECQGLGFKGSWMRQENGRTARCMHQGSAKDGQMHEGAQAQDMQTDICAEAPPQTKVHRRTECHDGQQPAKGERTAGWYKTTPKKHQKKRTTGLTSSPV
jgi:hypothetical protein